MRSAIVFSLLLGFVPAVSAQESPKAVVERAITAHGGHALLSQSRHERSKMRGAIHVGNGSVPFTSEITIRLPGLYRSVVQMREGERIRTLVHELDGDKVTLTIDDKPQSPQGAHINQLRQTLELESALRLVPLLDEKTFTLTHLGEFRLVQQTVIGVRVQGKAQRPLTMYFDRESALLVKIEQLLDGAGKDVKQEAYYREHREINGIKRPGRVAAYRDGKKVMEAELVEVTAAK